MIIKRSQSNSPKKQEQKSVAQENSVPVTKTDNNPSPSVSKKEEVKQEPKTPLSFEEIVFDSRQERRQGSRRRGFRRVDDRNIVSRAQEEANIIRELAVKDGHKLGIEKAQEDILKLRESIQEYFEYKDKVFSMVAPYILDISIEIAKKIIDREIAQDKTALLSLIKSALGDSFRSDNRITVKVKSEDAPTIKEDLPEFLFGSSTDAKIKVVIDDNIVSGGAIIVTDNGIVDATIDTGLTILEQAFKKLQQQIQQEQE